MVVSFVQQSRLLNVQIFIQLRLQKVRISLDFFFDENLGVNLKFQRF